EDAHQRGLPIVVITDSSLSPLARFADVAFVVNEAEVKSFRGLTASLCLTQALAIALGVRQDKSRDKALEKASTKKRKT
ncbi:SIS domain-containing protein, partial [Halomonas sp. TD01]